MQLGIDENKVFSNIPVSALNRIGQRKHIWGHYIGKDVSHSMVVTIFWGDDSNSGANKLRINARLSGQLSPASEQQITDCLPSLMHAMAFQDCSSAGPLHYLENTTYLAGTRDYYGAEAGEQLRDYKGLLLWNFTGAEDCVLASEFSPTAHQIPMHSITPLRGKGKERELAFARQSSLWPEATDEELSLPEAELRLALEKRLPSLLFRLKEVVESFGFIY
jgi:hypothetical protein